jgi:hypothetical protein
LLLPDAREGSRVHCAAPIAKVSEGVCHLGQINHPATI